MSERLETLERLAEPGEKVNHVLETIVLPDGRLEEPLERFDLKGRLAVGRAG